MKKAIYNNQIIAVWKKRKMLSILQTLSEKKSQYKFNEQDDKELESIIKNDCKKNVLNCKSYFNNKNKLLKFIHFNNIYKKL